MNQWECEHLFKTSIQISGPYCHHQYSESLYELIWLLLLGSVGCYICCWPTPKVEMQVKRQLLTGGWRLYNVCDTCIMLMRTGELDKYCFLDKFATPCHLVSGSKSYVCSVNPITNLTLRFEAPLAIWYHMFICFLLLDLWLITKTKVIVK